MHMSKSWCVSIFLFASIAVACAAQFSMQVDATVGLDNSTKRLIENFPKEMREQSLAGLRDALPLVDKSVDSYLDRVNQILDEQLNDVQCVGTGLPGNVIDQVATSLGMTAHPVQGLDDAKAHAY